MWLGSGVDARLGKVSEGLGHRGSDCFPWSIGLEVDVMGVLRSSPRWGPRCWL